MKPTVHVRIKKSTREKLKLVAAEIAVVAREPTPSADAAINVLIDEWRSTNGIAEQPVGALA